MTYARDLKNNIWKFYLFDACPAFLFAVPIIVLFWQENGLSLTEIMILQSIFSLLIVLLEIPTGYFADVVGRKNSLFVSGLCFVAAIIAYSVGTNFWEFVIAETAFAGALSFYSGAGAAFLYDTLKELKREDEYKKILGTSMFYALLVMAFANIVGGFIGKINLRWTFHATIPFMLLLIPITISFREPKRHKLVVKKGHLLHIARITKMCLHRMKLRNLILYAAVIMTLTKAVLWLYQPYFVLTNIDLVYFGFIFSSFHLVAALGSRYAHELERTVGMKTLLIAPVFLLAVSYFLMSKILFLFSFSFAFIQQFIRGFSEPVFTDYINQLTSSDIRATVLSVTSMFRNLLYALVIPVIGWLADVYSITQALFSLGIITLVVGSVVLVILHKGKSI